MSDSTLDPVECPGCGAYAKGRTCQDCGFRVHKDRPVTCTVCGERVRRCDADVVTAQYDVDAGVETVYLCPGCKQGRP